MDHRDASGNAEIVIVRIYRANKPFFSKPIGQTLRSNIQRSLRVLDNFHLDNEVVFERPFPF